MGREDGQVRHIPQIRIVMARREHPAVGVVVEGHRDGARGSVGGQRERQLDGRGCREVRPARVDRVQRRQRDEERPEVVAGDGL